MNRSARWVLIILGVLVAAFLAQRILTGDRAEGERTGFQALLAQIDREQVERVTLDVPNDRAEVTYAARAGTVDVLYRMGTRRGWSSVWSAPGCHWRSRVARRSSSC